MTLGQMVKMVFSIHNTLSDALVVIGLIGCILIAALMTSTNLNQPVLMALFGVAIGGTVIGVWNINVDNAVNILIFEMCVVIYALIFANQDITISDTLSIKKKNKKM